MKTAVPCRRAQASFTLAEILVALAVLSILLVFLGMVMTSVSSVSTQGRQYAENSGNARAILDLMSRELEAGVSRPDLNQTNWISLSTTGTMVGFWSRSLGSALPSEPGGNAPPAASYRPLSYIEYNLNQSAGLTNCFLERGDQAALWSDAPSRSLPLGYSSVTLPAPAMGNVLDGVVAFRVRFLQQDGSLTDTYGGTNTISAVVSLAVIDSKSLPVLLDSGKLPTLASALANAVDGTHPDPRAAWESAVGSATLLNGYPQQVRTGLRFFERVVDLPKPTL